MRFFFVLVSPSYLFGISSDFRLIGVRMEGVFVFAFCFLRPSRFFLDPRVSCFRFRFFFISSVFAPVVEVISTHCTRCLSPRKVLN